MSFLQKMSSRGRFGLVAVVSGLIVAAYLATAAAMASLGFPLDDAWIHLTYARNLAENGRLSFVPGVSSAGSTAPLWTLLLAVGYLLRLPYLVWTYLLGWLSLLLVAGSGMALWRRLWPDLAAADWAVGLALVGTWPLVWAAASGMETLFFIGLGLFIVLRYVELVQDDGANWRQTAVLGFLCGLLILTRPDGLVLVLLVGVGLVVNGRSWRGRVWQAALFGVLLALPLLPYFAFNWFVSGSVWPNTFYAKQTEYAVLLARPLVARVTQLLWFSLGGPDVGWQGMTGAHLLLLPGLLLAGWRALHADWRARRLLLLLPLLWAGGHVVLYAWRLPVTFQHGRYLMAAIPVWVLYGLAGWMWLLARGGANGRLAWVAQRVAGFTYVGLLLIFLGLGARAYATDVAFIENEMVDVAQWLAQNTPPDALIAAHDIGAIGYFAERPLLDLAGLISPEVIPLLADETALAQFVLSSEADYLVTAPGWPYEEIIELGNLPPIYTTDYAWTRENGLNNMTIFLLDRS